MAFPGWDYKCELIIQNTNVDADLSDYPVLLTINNLPSQIVDADGAGPALEGGGDLRFSSDEAGSTRIACEVVRFERDNNPALAKVEVWVEVASISSSSTTSIWVWWGKAAETQPAIDATYGQEDTWDDGGNNYHKAVWHFDEDPGPGGAGDIIDSTQYGNHGQADSSMTSGDRVDGAFDGGNEGRSYDFDGSNDYIEVPSDPSIVPGGGTDWTVSAFAAPPSTNQATNIVGKRDFSSPYPTYGMSIAGSLAGASGQKLLGIYVEGFFGGDRRKTLGAPDVADGGWHHYAMIADNTDDEVRVYSDGSELSVDGTDDSGSWPAPVNTDPLTIGGTVEGDGHFDGTIDEVRISEIDRSDAWINATYNFLDDPGANIIEQSVVETAQTIAMSAGGLTAAAQNLTQVSGPVTITINATGLISAAEDLTQISGPITISINAAGIVSIAQNLTQISGPVTIVTNPTGLTATAQQLTLVPGTATIPMNTAALIGAAQNLIVSADTTISMNAAGLNITAESLTVSIAMIVQMLAAGLTVTAQPLDVVPGAATISMQVANINLTGETIQIVPGGVTISANAATLTAIAQQLQVVPGEVTIAMQDAQIVGTAESLQVFEGATIITMQTAQIVSAGEQLQVIPGPVTITMQDAQLTFTAENLLITSPSLVIIKGINKVTGEPILIEGAIIDRT